MKNHYSIPLALMICIGGSAQTVNTSIATATNNVFSLLEKNRIPHDILLDYG